MRITFVLPLLGLEGGVRVVAEYARRLSDRGHEVTAVSLGRPKPPTWERWAKDRAKAGLRGDLRAALLPPPRFETPASHFDDLPGLHRRVPHAGPITAEEVPDADVVVATWWETAPWVAALPPSKGAKVHLIQHDERITGHTPADRERIGRAVWTPPGFTRVAVASWIAEVGRREYGAECGVVPNAVDLSLFDAPPRERNARPAVGFMDSAVPFKAAGVAQAAYEAARRQVPDLRLICFGFQPDPLRPLPPGAEFHQAPPQREIAGIYRSCDAWLFSSRCEGYGLPILEAMACRTPVVGTPTGAAPDLIGEGGDGGRLVPFDDPEAMAAAAVGLLTMPAAAWRATSDRARRIAEAHDWPTAVDRFERVLTDSA